MALSRAVLSVLLAVIFLCCASHAESIYPNDDCSTRGSTNYNAVSPFGLLVKNSSDVGWIEFDLGATAVTTATLIVHNDDTGVSNPWDIVVRGAEYDFSEATFSGTGVSGWEVVGTIPAVMEVAFYSLDITSFYNAHLGQRVTFQLGRNVQPGGSGPIFEDREGTKTGDGATYGPQLEVVSAPDYAWNPQPADGAVNVRPDILLEWSAGSGASIHQVYFGTTDTPVSQGNQETTTFSPGILEYKTTYYWRVDEVKARDKVVGPLWTFRTSVEGDTEPDGDVDFPDVANIAEGWLASTCEEANQWCHWRDIDRDGKEDLLDYSRLARNWLYGRPVKAGEPSPADGAVDVYRRPTLSWASDEDVESHDVYFGTSDPPAFKVSQEATSFEPGLLAAGTTYYWRIDETTISGITVGETWSFTTDYLPVEDEFDIVFPEATWSSKSPAYLGLDGAALDEFAARVGGVGCIVRQGHMVKAWGESSRGDWASAAKPVISTMLMFAIQDGLLSGPHDRIADWGWTMSAKDETMEFYHLANMTSGYARGEAPGAAWAYNDYAISLYARTVFDRVFQSTPDVAARNADRLGALQFEDGSIFSSRGGYGLYTSPRDFARIGWLWCNMGYWNGRQLLARQYFEDYMKALVSASVPNSSVAGSDYLGVGTYGGGTDQTPYGPGVYGFNWWFNPGRANWPDAPEDTVQANGHWGGEVLTVIPSLSLVVACRGNNGSFEPGSSASSMNQNLKLLVEACPPFPPEEIVSDPSQTNW